SFSRAARRLAASLSKALRRRRRRSRWPARRAPPCRGSPARPRPPCGMRRKPSFREAGAGREARAGRLSSGLVRRSLHEALVAAVDRYLRRGGLGEERPAHLRGKLGDVFRAHLGLEKIVLPVLLDGQVVGL